MTSFSPESNEIDDFSLSLTKLPKDLTKTTLPAAVINTLTRFQRNNSVKAAADADILKEEAIAKF